MEQLPLEDAAKLWADLRWTTSRLIRTGTLVEPLMVAEAPRSPGLYRMMWRGESWVELSQIRRVKATSQIADPVLSLAGVSPPVDLTIGRTCNVYARFRQHFGTNRNNNRVWARLRELATGMTEEQLRTLVVEEVEIEWVEIGSWVKRCILECYGFSVLRPVLDMDAEH